MFGGGFVAQWGIGLVVDAARAAAGLDAAGGLEVAFALVLALEVLTYALVRLGLAAGTRRTRTRPPRRPKQDMSARL